MREEARIRTAIENGEIRKIVMIDDAFDPPVLGDEDAGPMLEFLEGMEHAATLRRTGISPEEAEAAIQAINSSEYGEDALQSVVAKIYAKFVEKFDERFDPTGRFSVLKGRQPAPNPASGASVGQMQEIDYDPDRVRSTGSRLCGARSPTLCSSTIISILRCWRGRRQIKDGPSRPAKPRWRCYVRSLGGQT